MVGFHSYSVVVSIDGTHRCSKYRGTMLVAIGVGANDQLLRLAFVIVKGENNDSAVGLWLAFEPR